MYILWNLDLTKNALNTHIKVSHMNLKEFECDLCGKKFSIKLALENHTKLKHNNGEKETFPCDLCDKTFVLKCNLKRHRNVVHFGLKKVNCHICNKEISDSHFLFHNFLFK